MKVNSALCAVLILAVCGCSGGSGGGDGPAPASSPTAEGMWVGSTSSVRDITAFVLNDGAYWVFYSGGRWLNHETHGFIRGTGTSSGGSFSSSDAKDYNFRGLGNNDATVSASYRAKQSLNGSIVYASGGVTFTSVYSALYEQAPSLAAIAGSYPGLTISAEGAVSGRFSDGCQFTGSATPNTGANVYTLAIQIGGPPCVNGNVAASGIGYYTASTRKFTGAVVAESGGSALLVYNKN